MTKNIFKKTVAVAIIALFIGASITITPNMFVKTVKADLTTGLVGFWNFNEGSGSIAYDQSGTGNDATIFGGATWTTGISSNALSFNGINDYVEVLDNDNLEGMSELTIGLWVKIDQDNTGRDVLVSKWETGIGPYEIQIDATRRIDFWIYTTTGWYELIGSYTILEIGGWHSIVGVYDGTSQKLYLDGVETDSQSVTGSLTSNNYPLNIGRSPSLYDNYFNGIIDEVKIFTRALNDTEIFTVYASSGGLVGYWSFDEGSGSIAHDDSGSGFNGAILGASWTTGVSGGALHFDGVNDCVDLPDNNFKFQTFSISCWASCDSFGYYPPIFSVHNQALYGGWTIQGGAVATGNTINLVTSGTAGQLIDMVKSQPIVISHWYHIVGVKTPSYMKIYIDGELIEEDNSVSSVIYSGCVYGDDFLPFIGCGLNLHIIDRYFHGKIDEVRVYNRALESSEVDDLYNEYAIDTNLVGYWSFDEGSGTFLQDESENNNHGTIYGDAQWTQGISGQALMFDGVNDYVKIPDSDSIRISGDITLSAWVKTSTMKSTDPIISKGPGDHTFGYFLGTGTGYPPHQASFQLHPTGEPGIDLHSEETLSVEQWYHIVGTRSGTSMKIYINGVLDNTIICFPGSIRTNTYPLDFGAHYSYSVLYKGILDEVRIYNRALSVTEIQYLHDNPGGAENQPPILQSFIVDKQDGQINELFTFSATATDPNGDNIYYKFYWGDGSSSNWFGKNSGEPKTQIYHWTSTGTYNVIVHMKDDPNGDGNADDGIEVVSNPLIITIYQPTHKVLVVPTIYNDLNYQDFDSYRLDDLREKVDEVSDYYHIQSFGQVNIAFYCSNDILDVGSYNSLTFFEDNLWDGTYYSPPLDYVVLVRTNVNPAGYNAILGVQIYPGYTPILHEIFAFREVTYYNLFPNVACINSYGTDTGVIAHELGHAIFLFDDFYGQAGELFCWCLMARGCDMIPTAPIFSVNKIGKNWLQKDEKLVTPNTIREFYLIDYEKMNSNNKVPLILIPTMGEKFPQYYIEARSKYKNGVSWDSERPGIVIYKQGKQNLYDKYIEAIPGEGSQKKDNWEKWIIYPSISEPNPIWSDPWTGLKFTYLGEDNYFDYFVPNIRVEYSIVNNKNMIGAGIQGALDFIRGLGNNFGTPPVNETYDLDLHAYTTTGLHIGMNYTSGLYECQVSGAAYSGNLANGEYILVPKGTPVNFQVKFIAPENTTVNFTTHVFDIGENPQAQEIDGKIVFSDYNIFDGVLRTLKGNETLSDLDGDGIPFYQEILDGTNPNDGPVLLPYLSVLVTPPLEFAKSSTFGLIIKVKAGDVNINGANITLKSEHGVLFSNIVDLGYGNYSVTVTVPGDYPTNILNVTANASRTGFINGSSEIILFRTLPTTVKTIGSPKYGNNNEWVSSSTKFNLSATDDLSGVNKIYYRIWYNSIWTPWMDYHLNFTLIGEGKHYLEFYSVDNVGNVEEAHNQTHYVDDSLPIVTISASPSSLWPPNNKMENVLISGSATDAGSGIASITFTVEDEYNLVEPTLTGFGQTIQLQAMRYGYDMDGRTYTITATATDNLGHLTTASTIVRVPHDQGN